MASPPQKARYQEYIIAYEYEKLAGGLVDAWEYAGYPKAFFFLEKITDWFIAHSPPAGIRISFILLNGILFRRICTGHGGSVKMRNLKMRLNGLNIWPFGRTF